MQKINPLFTRVLVEPYEEEKETKAGILLVSKARKYTIQTGVVAEVGPDVKHVKKGDKIVYAIYVSTELEVDGKPMFMVEEQDILMTFND